MDPSRNFEEMFRNSAVKRTKWAGLVRNACIALGNAAASNRNLRIGSRTETLLRATRQSRRFPQLPILPIGRSGASNRRPSSRRPSRSASYGFYLVEGSGPLELYFRALAQTAHRS